MTEIIADEVGDKVKVISGICCEGTFEAIEHSKDVKAAGADAILLMPCHHWLRFGRTPETAIGYFEDVANGADIPIILHQYPQLVQGNLYAQGIERHRQDSAGEGIQDSARATLAASSMSIAC